MIRWTLAYADKPAIEEKTLGAEWALPGGSSDERFPRERRHLMASFDRGVGPGGQAAGLIVTADRQIAAG